MLSKPDLSKIVKKVLSKRRCEGGVSTRHPDSKWLFCRLGDVYIINTNIKWQQKTKAGEPQLCLRHKYHLLVELILKSSQVNIQPVEHYYTFWFTIFMLLMLCSFLHLHLSSSTTTELLLSLRKNTLHYTVVLTHNRAADSHPLLWKGSREIINNKSPETR